MSSRLLELSSQFLQDRHHLLAYIRSMVHEQDIAEDIFQDVWLRLSDATEKGIEITSPLKWCRGVARNLALHHWRSRRNAKVVVDSELVDLLDLAFEEQDPEQDLWATRWRAMQECIAELPQTARSVLQLRYVEDLSMDTIAGRIRKSLSATMTMLSRLRQVVAKCTEEKLQCL